MRRSPFLPIALALAVAMAAPGAAQMTVPSTLRVTHSVDRTGPTHAELSGRVFNDGPVITNFRAPDLMLGAATSFPLGTLDFIPDLLIHGHCFFESSTVKSASANGVHHAFGTRPELFQAFLALGAWVFAAFWPCLRGGCSKRLDPFDKVAADMADYQFLKCFATDAQVV